MHGERDQEVGRWLRNGDWDKGRDLIAVCGRGESVVGKWNSFEENGREYTVYFQQSGTAIGFSEIDVLLNRCIFIACVHET